MSHVPVFSRANNSTCIAWFQQACLLASAYVVGSICVCKAAIKEKWLEEYYHRKYNDSRGRWMNEYYCKQNL